MKQIPQFSLVIFPTQKQIAMIHSYKQLLKKEIGWFGSVNANAHITIIQFDTDLEFTLYIDNIREFCKKVVPQQVIFNSWGKFENAGAFFLAPDKHSKLYIDGLIVNLHHHLGFKIDAKTVNAHMSIARKLFGENMIRAEELLKDIKVDLQFNCDALYVRKFNTQTQQYSDTIEKIHFGN